MHTSRLPLHAAAWGLAAVFIIAPYSPAAAQDKPDNWFMRLARGAAAAAIEADMGNAQPVDLEAAGLTPVVYAGPVVFGISGLEIQNGVGLRLKAYLHNPSEETVAAPVPVLTNFVLVDQLGRRIEVASMAVERLQSKAKVLDVPALERLAVNLLFFPPEPNAQAGALKVGTAGIIRGIPLSTANAASQPTVPVSANSASGTPQAPFANTTYPPGQPDASNPVAGSWGRGTIAAHIGGDVPRQGGAYSDGFLYTFYPDGTYESSGIMEAAGAGRVLMYAGGRYAIQGNQITLAREGGTFVNEKMGTQRKLDPETKQYHWQIEKDPFTDRAILKLMAPGYADDIFYKREN